MILGLGGWGIECWVDTTDEWILDPGKQRCLVESLSLADKGEVKLLHDGMVALACNAAASPKVQGLCGATVRDKAYSLLQIS